MVLAGDRRIDDGFRVTEISGRCSWISGVEVAAQVAIVWKTRFNVMMFVPRRFILALGKAGWLL